jgi:DNA primase
MNLQQLKKFLLNKPEELFAKLGMKIEVFGDNIYSTCPVHESSDNPRAFSFSKQRGIWKCWTRDCQNHYRNDVFGLIRGVLSSREGQDVEFSQALKWISKEFNIYAKSDAAIENIEDEDEFTSIVAQLKDNISFPQNKTVNLDLSISIPSEYFHNRGFDKKTLEYFEVGDCLDTSSKLYDRAIIPIHNEDGSSKIGYICRAIKEYKIPKFLIYPKGFDKRFVFYNLHRAMPSIKATNTLFIVEGQGDVWRLYESGIHNVVGIFGRTLTKEQQQKLQTLPVTRIIILTDNDQAGRESKIQLQRQLGRFYKLSFPYLQHKDVGDMTIKQIKNDILSQIRG